MTPQPARDSLARRVWTGATAALQGFGFAFAHRSLWLLCLISTVTYALIWLAVLGLATHLVQVWLRTHLLDSAESHLLGSGPWHALWQLARAGVYLLAWLLAAAVALVVALPLLSPLFSWLAARTERQYFGQDSAESQALSLVEPVRALGRAAALGGIQLGGSLLLWLLGLLLSLVAPPLGPPFALLVGGAWNALWLAALLIGFALDEHRTPLTEQIALLRRHAPTWLGFGAVASVLAWLPPAVPFLVVGGTVLVCRMHQRGDARLQGRTP